MNANDVIGAVWSPDDGRVSPSDLCAALVKGARARGARIREDTAVTGILTRGGRVTGIETDRGTVRCDAVALHRPVEPQGGRHGRRRGPGLAMRALLPAHPAHRRHRRQRAVAVGPRRPSLYPRRFGRAADRLLQVARQAHRSRLARRRFRLPVACGGLGPLRADDDERPASASRARDRASEDAAERAGKLYPRRLLPARRGDGDPRALPRLRHELRRGGHRRRRRHGPRSLHRPRPAADGPARGGPEALPVLLQFRRRARRTSAGSAGQALRDHLSGAAVGDEPGPQTNAARESVAGGKGALRSSLRLRTAALLRQGRGARRLRSATESASPWRSRCSMRSFRPEHRCGASISTLPGPVSPVR